jgi:hypothetical protein
LKSIIADFKQEIKFAGRVTTVCRKNQEKSDQEIKKLRAVTNRKGNSNYLMGKEMEVASKERNVAYRQKEHAINKQRELIRRIGEE